MSAFVGYDMHAKPTVVDGYWTLPCQDGCDGTGRYVAENLPDFGNECVACKGTGRIVVTLAAPTDSEEIKRG